MGETLAARGRALISAGMDLAEQGAMSPVLPHTADWIGAVGAVFPFVFRYSERSATGELSPVDWVAIVGGLVALVAGVFTLSLLRRAPPEQRSARIGVSVALLAFGVLHFAFRGFGLL